MKLPVRQEYKGESVGCLVLVSCSTVGWVPAVCIAEVVATGIKRITVLSL